MIIYAGKRVLHANNGKTDMRNGVCLVKKSNGEDLESLVSDAEGNPFDWGNMGSKSMNLARSLLVDFFKKNSDDIYFNQVVFFFCKEVTKKFDYMGWEIDEDDLKEKLTNIVERVYGETLYEN